MAVIINCDVLSFDSLWFSISAIKSCGTREASFLDLLLILLVIIILPDIRLITWVTCLQKKKEKTTLIWVTLELNMWVTLN